MKNLQIEVEVYDKGALYSLHSSSTTCINTNKLIVLLFPRAFTPVCSSEVDELSEKCKELTDQGWTVTAGSCDSPEVMQQWKPDCNIPLLTVKNSTLLLNEYILTTGYTSRTILWIKDGVVIDSYREGNDLKRDWDTIVMRTKKLR